MCTSHDLHIIFNQINVIHNFKLIHFLKKNVAASPSIVFLIFTKTGSDQTFAFHFST